MLLNKAIQRLQGREEGFTLVELLIVVAIIAILAAIAIPQFSAYRKRGYAATVNSDAKNAYTAGMAYLVDNPAGTLASCTSIAAAGYQSSVGTTCATDMSAGAGGITITGTVSWGLTTNTASITYAGVLTKAAP